MALLNLLRRLRRSSDGAALVEFTIAAPLLLLLMCGVVEMANAMRQYHVMEKGVRDAARYLAASSANPPCVGVADPPGYSWSQAKTEAKHLALYGVTSGGAAFFKGWTDDNTVTVNDGTCLTNPRGASANPLARVTVTATATYSQLGMLSLIGLASPTLTVSHQELKVF